MFRPLKALLGRIVRSGDLTFIDHAEERSQFGDGTGGPVVVRLADRRIEFQLALDPELAAGEGYMNGRLTMEAGTIYDFIALMMRNLEAVPYPAWAQGLGVARRLARRISQFNTSARSRRNVKHHYDIDPRIYELFLDPDQQYSCAYFTPGADLSRAQLLKKRHIAAKLDVGAGQRVLDIGSGWGGLALYLAQTTGANVVGVTLSDKQIKTAQARAAKLGLGKAVAFELKDYRKVEGRFDRIVSVGMFEHVGIPHYATFFSTIARLLEDDGIALLHTIGRSDRPAATNPFIARYIFPGGYIPALSEVMAAVEQSGLICTDVEVLRLHYAETLRAWRSRFLANRARAAEIAGEEFCRMWEFYLAGSEAAFRHQGMVVFQIQLAKRVDTLPITRDYMLEGERRLALREGKGQEGPRLAGE